MPLGHAGTLTGPDYRALCVVEDISVTGARVRLLSVQIARPRALPEQLTLDTQLAGEAIVIDGIITRVERDADAVRIALHFFDGDASWLGWWINEAQRRSIRANRPEPVEEPAQLARASTAGAPA